MNIFYGSTLKTVYTRQSLPT